MVAFWFKSQRQATSFCRWRQLPQRRTRRRRGGGVTEPFAPAPPGTALPDFARRNPSEIPSQTQSVSAFPPGKFAMGAPFLRRITLRALPPLRRKSVYPKNKKGTGRLQACPLNASPCSVSCYPTARRDGDHCLVGGEHIAQFANRLNSCGFPKTVPQTLSQSALVASW